MTRRAPVRVAGDYGKELEKILDVRISELNAAQEVVDTLQPDEYFRETMVGPIPNEWIRLRNEYRQQAETMLFKLVNAGIADRAVKVKEAQAVLLAQQVRAAAERAGLKPEQVQALGRELRDLAREQLGS